MLVDLAQFIPNDTPNVRILTANPIGREASGDDHQHHRAYLRVQGSHTDADYMHSKCSPTDGPAGEVEEAVWNLWVGSKGGFYEKARSTDGYDFGVFRHHNHLDMIMVFGTSRHLHPIIDLPLSTKVLKICLESLIYGQVFLCPFFGHLDVPINTDLVLYDLRTSHHHRDDHDYRIRKSPPVGRQHRQRNEHAC